MLNDQLVFITYTLVESAVHLGATSLVEEFWFHHLLAVVILVSYLTFLSSFCVFTEGGL